MSDLIKPLSAVSPNVMPDPIVGMREAWLHQPAPDYTTIARRKAAVFERTGLLGLAGVWVGPQLIFRHFLSFGSDEQRAEWAGRPLAVAISEPRVGAHPKLLTTCAERVGDCFRITGQKAWVSNGQSAEGIIVLAITAEQGTRKQYSAFIVPRGTSGLTTADMPEFPALRPSKHCLLTLDGCLVPAGAMLGEPGSAYEQMALPFRDIEDAVGSLCILLAIRRAIRHLAGETPDEQAAEVGAIAALAAVFEAGAEAVTKSLDDGSFQTGDTTLVGLLVLAGDLVQRLRHWDHLLSDGLAHLIGDLEATLSIARVPRLARQARVARALARSAVIDNVGASE